MLLSGLGLIFFVINFSLGCSPKTKARTGETFEQPQNSGICKISIDVAMKSAGSATYWPLVLDPLNYNFKDLTDSKTVKKEIHLKKNEILILECPGEKNTFVALNNVKTARATCNSDTKFEVNEIFYDFYDLGCKEVPKISVKEETFSNCPGMSFSIGFDLEYRNTFLRNIDTCIDKDSYSVLFTNHTFKRVTDSQKRTQTKDSFNYDHFPKEGLSGKNIYDLYKRTKIDETFSRILTDEVYKRYFHDATAKGSSYISRGHLAANQNFVYESQQISTYFYINVNPQVQAFNEHNWAELETNLKIFATNKESDLEVFTGSKGVLKINEKSLYLLSETDNGKNERVPVPLYFWKVYWPKKNPSEKLAFIGINTPSLNSQDFKELAKKTLQEICGVNMNEDDCNRKPYIENLTPTFLKNRKKIEMGYIACCEFEKLVKNAKLEGIFHNIRH